MVTHKERWFYCQGFQLFKLCHLHTHFSNSKLNSSCRKCQFILASLFCPSFCCCWGEQDMILKNNFSCPLSSSQLKKKLYLRGLSKGKKADQAYMLDIFPIFPKNRILIARTMSTQWGKQKQPTLTPASLTKLQKPEMKLWIYAWMDELYALSWLPKALKIIWTLNLSFTQRQSLVSSLKDSHTNWSLYGKQDAMTVSSSFYQEFVVLME